MIFRLKQCDSTNSELRARLEKGEASVGSCLWSETQTHGRGRGSNTWKSSEGGFFFSAFTPVNTTEPTTWIPLRAALWVAQVLENVGAKLAVKWPNDLLSVTGEKFCGILCERIRDGVIVGIGINQHSPDLPFTTGLLAMKIQIPNAQLALHLSETMTHWFGEGAHPLADIVREYEARAYFKPGTRVTWRPKQSSNILEGNVTGLGEWGELVLVSQQAKVVHLYAEEVSAVR